MNISDQDTPRAGRPPDEWSGGFDTRLLAVLRQNNVAAESIDPRTVRFRSVPISEELFDKPRTNLLLQRMPTESGASVFVDNDLGYQGPDRVVSTAFTGPCRRNWRRLRFPLLPGTVNEAFCTALDFLSSPLAPGVRQALKVHSREPPGEGASGRVLAAAGELITAEMAAAAYDASFRRGLARQLAVLPTRSTLPRSALLWGRPGCGRDHLMLAAVHPLFEAKLVSEVYRVSAATLAAGCIFSQEIDNSLMSLLADATTRDGSLLLLQNLDVCLTASSVGHCLLCDALDRGLRMFATVRSEGFLGRLRGDEAVARRVLAVHVPPADEAQTIEVLQQFARQIAIDVAPEALETIVRTTDRQGAAQPAAAVGLLGAALAEATWAGRSQIGPDDVVTVLQNQWPEDELERSD